MDFNDAIFSGIPTDPKLQASIAASLRNRDQMGTIMAMTGDKALAPVGQQFIQQGGADRQRATLQKYYADQAAQSKANLEEEKRQHDMMFQLGQERNQAMRDVAGIRSSAKATKVPVGWANKVQEEVTAYRNLGELKGSYDPKWTSSFTGSGALRQTMGRYLPMVASEETKAFQEWRREFESWYVLAKRHKLFGGALTKPEIQAWEATTLGKDATPEQVMNFFNATMKEIEPQVQGSVNIFRGQFGDERTNELLGEEATAPAGNELDAQIMQVMQALGMSDAD